MALDEATKILRKRLTTKIKPAVKKMRRDAKLFKGSKLKKRTGKTAKTIRVTVPSRGKHGVVVNVKGAGFINIWEYGHKAYTVKAKGKGFKFPWGFMSKKEIRIPAEVARPVLIPVVEEHQGELMTAARDALQDAAIKVIADRKTG